MRGVNERIGLIGVPVGYLEQRPRRVEQLDTEPMVGRRIKRRVGDGGVGFGHDRFLSVADLTESVEHALETGGPSLEAGSEQAVIHERIVDPPVGRESRAVSSLPRLLARGRPRGACPRQALSSSREIARRMNRAASALLPPSFWPASCSSARMRSAR